MINKSQITRVYSGKIGCACGCRGTYSTNKSLITKAYNDYLRLNSKNPFTENKGSNGEQWVAWTNHTGTRTYTIYFKKEIK
jgi:hypothetical protein